jgi:uncharacterized membrane protein YcaP (DUF421 family)
MHSKIFADMFYLGLPWLEKIFRPILVYTFLIVGLRMAGKRELAQLNPFDLVVLLTLSNAVQNAIIGDDNSVTGGVIGGSTLLFVNYLVVRFLYSHGRLDQLVEGAPDTLIHEGKVHAENCQRELITESELAAAAHRHGFSTLEEVETAILETGGTISFSAKKPTPDLARHEEVLKRLDDIGRRLDGLNLGTR